MFSQGQGVLTPQMLHMQRLMGNRPHRSGSAFFSSGDVEMVNTNSSMDTNDQYSMGMAPHNFNTFGQPNHMMTGFSNRSSASDMANFPVLMGQNCGMGAGSNGSATTSNEGFIGSLGARMPVFKCPECGIVKNSTEELEVHIKTEHLGWLPFQCPICTALRASDLQMREHIHSHHKKNENKYIYVDNPHAKGMLQEMIDRALFGASQYAQQFARRGGGNMTQLGGAQNQVAKRARIDTQNTVGERRNNSVLAVKRVPDEVTSSRNQAQKSSAAKNEGRQSDEGTGGRGSEGSANDQQKRNQSETNNVDEETDAQLSTIFGRKVKSEFDMATGCSPDALVVPDEDEDNLPDDNSHQMNALQNVSAMFSASGGGTGPQLVGGVQRNSATGVMQRQQQQQINQQNFCRRVVRNRPGPMTSKKRVLGLCADCDKPITAGARQMHMFYHLGKDMNTYRFRCKHPGCKVQHYRKDQMENHQSKAHGKVDTDMMEDRSMELYNMVQDMSMRLLGTSGNTPGPTAVKAQQIYEKQMREMEANLGVRKRRRPEYFGCNIPPNNTVSRSSGLPIYDSANRRVEDLECRLCNKFILNRIKGFHILWHLNTDLGIVRYGCKYCNFKHDRPQSVAAHGVREHGDDTACEDLLYNYENELKQMSKACFGVERLFEKEIRRRNRLERFARCSVGSPAGRVEDDANSHHGNNELKKSQQLVRRRSQQHIVNLKVPLKSENAVDRDWTPKDPVRKRRSGGRRFFGSRGRKPMTRKARDVMIKLREVSMRLGGAQYFKKRSNEAISCEKCSKLVVNRLSDHAYSHLEECNLFRCQQCNLGHYSRETIVRHLKDFHNSHEAPMDNRLRYAQEIKDSIRECYPQIFKDEPIPTKEDIEKLRESLNLSDQVLVCDKDEEEEEAAHEQDAEEGELIRDDTNEHGDGDEEEEEKEEEQDEAEQQSNAIDEEDGEVIDDEQEEDDDYEDDEEGQDVEEEEVEVMAEGDGKGEEEESVKDDEEADEFNF